MTLQEVEQLVEDFDHDAFRARLKNAVRNLGIRKWTEYCSKVGLPPQGALNALEECKSGLARDVWPNIDILEQLAQGVGRDLEWLVKGHSSNSDFVISLSERVHGLVDEYAYKEQLPEDDTGRLHSYVHQMIDGLHARTPEAAYRRGLPQTWKDVAWIYDEMVTMQG